MAGGEDAWVGGTDPLVAGLPLLGKADVGLHAVCVDRSPRWLAVQTASQRSH